TNRSADATGFSGAGGRNSRPFRADDRNTVTSTTQPVTSRIARPDGIEPGAGRRVRPTVAAPDHTYNPTRRRQMRPIRRAAGGGMSAAGPSQAREWSGRLVAGDEHALREVYRAHAPVVLGLATRVLGDPTTAEDVLQDVFVRLWERPQTYDPDRGSLRSYLLTITH